ncbi:MAG: diguanylate cyclase [Magnetococcales bacterium]|nr:diguanylate cyclase [Magnetococcales bacterium]
MTTPAEKSRILIVDDIPGNIKMLAEILRDEFHISMANNGKTAVKLAVSNQPDLILLDIIMPQMDGYEVCATLKADPATQEIPIVFVTGQNEDMDETKGLSLGAIDYVFKPPKPAILKARVRNHIETKRQKDILHSLSTIDGLTNIANRRQFDITLDQEWRRSVRGSLGMAIIMLDIDHFKKFNDHFGHRTGDDCLQKVAAALEESLMRSTDLIARYGGEEFAAILPQVDHTGAQRVAENMRANVESLKISHPMSDTSRYVTISLGCATIFPTRDGSAKTLLEAADKMLYKAKQSGRNQYEGTVI